MQLKMVYVFYLGKNYWVHNEFGEFERLPKDFHMKSHEDLFIRLYFQFKKNTIHLLTLLV